MFIKQLSTQSVSPLSNTFLFELANIPEEDQNLLKKLSLRALNMIYTYTNGRVITETNFEIYIDYDELDSYSYTLPVRPITTITSISSFDVDNAETVMDTADYYYVVGDNTVFFKDLPRNVRPNRSYKIAMTAGYDFNNTPLDLIAAVEQLTIFLYENRGDTATLDIPVSIRMLLDTYVIHRF